MEGLTMDPVLDLSATDFSVTLLDEDYHINEAEYFEESPKKIDTTKDDLLSFLDTLGQQVSHISKDSFSKRGVCEECKGDIVGAFVTNRGKMYHPEHFCCRICRTLIPPNSKFLNHFGTVCESCFDSNFAKSCSKCNKPIRHRIVDAMNLIFHPECFQCTTCGSQLNGTYYNVDGLPYCEKDYQNIFK